MGNDLDFLEDQQQQQQLRRNKPLSSPENATVSSLSPPAPPFSRSHRSSISSRGRRRGMYYFITGVTLLLAITYQALRSERISFDGLFTTSSGGGSRSGGGGFKTKSNGKSGSRGGKKNSKQKQPVPVTSIVPSELLYEDRSDGAGGEGSDNEIDGENLYQLSDFINERGVIPTYWSSHFDITNSTTITTTSDSSSIRNDFKTTKQASKTANAYQITNHVNHNDILSWGPCYPPLQSISSKKTKRQRSSSASASVSSEIINWSNEIQKANELKPAYHYERNRIAVEEDGIYNKCRPGFIIIGAGKCGTSSLYHYLTDGHPRIIPAFSKQIHYFVVSLVLLIESRRHILSLSLRGNALLVLCCTHSDAYL